MVTPSARAEATSFFCNGTDSTNGTYPVDVGVLVELGECSGNVILSSSITRLQYATYVGMEPHAQSAKPTPQLI